jgi:tRNA-Thr(GGU) m(6)t(6)A37 methyltransferase TsaA
MTDKIILEAIGTIRTPFKKPVGTPIQGLLDRKAEGTLVLREDLVEGLRDLEGFSHLILVYHFDRVEGFDLVTKPYLEDEDRGMFAIRSPRRPNPIGVTVVSLLKIDGNRVLVRGVDMLDRTPLLDIKPYVPDFDSVADARTGWLEARLEAYNQGEPVRTTADDRFHK